MTKLKALFESEKFKKWLKNSEVYAIPAAIIFLTAIQQGVPVKQALYSVYLWGLDVLIDGLKKITGATSVK